MKHIIISVIVGAFRDGITLLISTLDFYLIYIFSKQVLFCSSGWTGTQDVCTWLPGAHSHTASASQVMGLSL